MPKINQEEYEKIKLLPDYDWNWIAREKTGKILSFTNKPTKTDEVWKDKQTRLWFNYKDSQLFQFIQWEDEEPYEIAELIREYKNWVKDYEVDWNKVFGREESVETEVKKDKLWAKIKVQEELESWEGVEGGLDEEGINYILNIIDQLDEPELLSQEWISENVEYAYFDYAYFDMLDGSGKLSYATEIIRSEKLKNLIVPKQEELETKIQELIESYKQEEDAYSNPENGWIGGFIEDLKNLVEKEQKYYVMNNDNRVMLVRMMDGKTITEADPFKLEDMYEGEKKSHRLTEQEIKDYDERYWSFAKKVEELEE